MYVDFYGFREKPFNLTPDPRFVFLSKNHREAFAHLLYGIDHHVGFISLTGEVGSGKTTVLRTLLSQLDADHYRTALIFNPSLSAPELLQNINREFGVPASPSDGPGLLDGLNQFLLQQNAEGRTVVLIIDEAQDLDAPVLEQIRLISNLETDREKLIQIVLSGQPEFMQILERREMRQLSQRITVRYHLKPMDLQDTAEYVNHRLMAAGARGKDVFSPKALKRIYRYSGGLPRLVNAACDRALLAGYASDATRIGPGIAEKAIRDLPKNRTSNLRRRRLILVPAFLMAAAFFAVIYVNWQEFVGRFNPSRRIEAKEEQTKKTPSITGEDLSAALVEELGKVPESESARAAFNALANRWNVSAMPEGTNLQGKEWERAARERSLRLYRFSGNLGALLRVDYPAVLELTLPGTSGKRFLSLVAMENGQLLINPAIAGRTALSFGELEKYWSGQGLLLWKDPLNLPDNISAGSRGPHVRRLQDLLREAGAFDKSLTGVYDQDTRLAVREFQSSRGIREDGIAGNQTLMLLYRSVDRFEVPRLTGGRK